MANIRDIFNEQLDDDNIVFLDEGLFDVSPAIALFALKDDITKKINKTKKSITDPIENIAGNVVLTKEKIKAKTIGKSGNSDDDIVYKLSGEQKKALAYIYKKYGSQMVKEIIKFRNDVMLPYQIVKKNVSKNKSLTNKEVFGMTKEDYYKYRESGRKKIEKMGTYFSDAKDLRTKNYAASDSLNKAREILNNFKTGKIIDLTATNIEKILDDCGLGRNELGGWSEVELEKTFTKIKNLQEKLKNANLSNGNDVRVFGRANSKNVQHVSRESIENQIKYLQEFGVSNGLDKDGGRHTKKFSVAFSMYALRKEKMREIKSNTSNDYYRALYKKVLENAVQEAERNYQEKHSNYTSLKGSIELNQIEEKIWKLKKGGVKFSGDINDWYLAIKPEHFFETKYYKKSDKVIAAEKEIDAALKRFERSLKRTISDEDLAMCRKYRLFNNFYTVKELKSPEKMFKKESDLNFDSDEIINSFVKKEYNSIKDLETAQSELKSRISGLKLSSKQKQEVDDFLEKIDPKNNSGATKISRDSLQSIINSANESPVSGKTEANELLKKLDDMVSDFEKVNGPQELKPFEYEINKAKNRLNGIIRGDD